VVRDVSAEGRLKNTLYDLRLLVRHSSCAPLVELQGMTGRTMLIVVNRLHVRSHRLPRLEGRQSAPRRSLSGVLAAERPWLRNPSLPMAVGALQLGDSSRRLQVAPEVDLVIELDAAGVAMSGTQRNEFRMSVRN